MWSRTRAVLLTLLAAMLGTCLFAGAGFAAGANASALESRGAFVTNLALTLGLTPTYPPRPTFRDVPPTSPYYGYIEAAVAAGWLSGVAAGRFGASLPLERDQVAKLEVLALGYGAAAQDLADTRPPFRDAARIPRWAWGYVDEAARLGILKGDRHGDFLPTAPLTVQQEGFVVAQLKDFLAQRAPARIEIVPSPATVPVGRLVHLTAIGYTVTGASLGPVAATFSTADHGASVNGASFRASYPGTYTVSADIGNGITATATIHVVGTPAALRITAPPSVVADGSTTVHVSVTVLDQTGAILHGALLTVRLESLGADVLALVDPSTGDLLPSGHFLSAPLKDGTAVFTLRSGTAVGQGTVLRAVASDGLSAEVGVVAARPQPAAVRLSPAFPCIENDDGNGLDTFTAVVLDQTGHPLLSGNYPVTFTVTGPATFADGSQSFQSFYNPVLPGSGAAADVRVAEGATGTVTVTASVGSISASATATAESAGPPVALSLSGSVRRLSADAMAAPTAGSPAFIDTLTITPVDRSGCPTPWGSAASPARALLTAALAGGTSSLLLPHVVTFTGQSEETVPVLAPPAADEDHAGRYTFRVVDASSTLAGATTTLTVVPGAPAHVAILSPLRPLVVPRRDPSLPVLAAVEDAEGNPVPLANVQVRFSLVGASPGSRLSVATARTGPSGVAATTLSLPRVSGSEAAVEVTSTTPGLPSPSSLAVSAPVTVVPAVAHRLFVRLSSGTPDVVAGTPLHLLIVPVGARPAHDRLLLTTTGFHVVVAPDRRGRRATRVPGGFLGTVDTLEALTLEPLTVGQASLTVEDLSTPTPLTASRSVTVVAARPARFELMDAFGDDLAYNGAPSPGGGLNDDLPFTPGVPTPIWLTPVDAFGNMTADPSPVPTTVELFTSGSGEFRLTPAGGPVTRVTLRPGAGPLELYYVNDGASVSYDDLIATYVPTATSLTLVPASSSLAPGASEVLWATLKDQFGGPAAGVDVTFSLSGGGSLSMTETTTDAAGVATVTYTAPQAAGTATLRALSGSAEGEANIQY